MDPSKSLDEKINIDNNLSNRYIDLDPNGYFIIKIDLDGNVLGSRGSIAPLFLSLKNSGSFPITHREMTRFNITLKESVEMVDWTIKNALGGEIVVPKLKSFKVTDMAKAINPKNRFKIILSLCYEISILLIMVYSCVVGH